MPMIKQFTVKHEGGWTRMEVELVGGNTVYFMDVQNSDSGATFVAMMTLLREAFMNDREVTIGTPKGGPAMPAKLKNAIVSVTVAR